MLETDKVIEINEQEEKELNLCLEKFRMAITLYYSMLIDPDHINCPIKKQAVPSFKELIIDETDMQDPLCEDSFSPVKGIVHRYPDRVLFLLTHKCSMYCRHCTRRRLVGEEDFSM